MIELLEPRIAPISLAFGVDSQAFDKGLRMSITVERIADNQVRTVATLSYAKWDTPPDDLENDDLPPECIRETTIESVITADDVDEIVVGLDAVVTDHNYDAFLSQSTSNLTQEVTIEGDDIDVFLSAVDGAMAETTIDDDWSIPCLDFDPELMREPLVAEGESIERDYSVYEMRQMF